MKIDAKRAWLHPKSGGFWYEATQDCEVVRVVRESDWRKIMAVLREADYATEGYDCVLTNDLEEAVYALRKHLAKRKADAATDANT